LYDIICIIYSSTERLIEVRRTLKSLGPAFFLTKAKQGQGGQVIPDEFYPKTNGSGSSSQSSILNSHISLFIMFQRTILRQAQAARSILSTSSPSTASLALRRTTQQPRIPAIRAFAPQSTRLYSTETKEATESETAENAEAEDPCKKELEQKTKEAIEFKVNHFPILRVAPQLFRR
jgi:hypothetical protein